MHHIATVNTSTQPTFPKNGREDRNSNYLLQLSLGFSLLGIVGVSSSNITLSLYLCHTCRSLVVVVGYRMLLKCSLFLGRLV